MNPILRRWGDKPQALLLALFLQAPLVSGAETASFSSPGLIDFAGRAARNYSYLFGKDQHDDLKKVNREMRVAQWMWGAYTDEAGRHAAIKLGDAAAQRLLELVRASPQLIRVDFRTARPVLQRGGPIELLSDTGALLFEVVTGGEGVSFSTALPGTEYTIAQVEAAASGTTYVVAQIEHLPAGRSVNYFTFRRPGQEPRRVPIELAVPVPGRLKLAVLSDDTGQPTPAMVQLFRHADGTTLRPVNGIEFAPQFEGQNEATGERNVNLPGLQSAAFWCVTGPFDMTVSPGDWTIGVRRGAEHEAVFEEVTIRSDETLERTYRPKRWVDMRGHGWWSGDDHVHCQIVSDDDARNLIAWEKAEDLHLANIVKMGNINRTSFEQRGFGPAYRVSDGEFVLSPGQECPRTDDLGHVLAMNITNMVRNPERYFLYDEAFNAVHAQGGFTGYAHVNADLFHVHRDMTLNVPRQKVDFAEILQYNQLGTDLYYEFLNLGCKLTASAGTDVPWGGTIGEVRTYAYLGQTPFSADAWFEAFGRGRTFVSSGPMLQLRVDDALPGDEIRVKSDRELRIHARAWGDPKRMAPIKLEIVQHGKVVQTVESSDPTQAEATIDMTLDAGYGCWIAARARAGDGTSAHTTPVYVVREGFRCWKFNGLDALLTKRLANLDEIEQMVAEAKKLAAHGLLEDDYYHKQLAAQGDVLLERVARARDLYAGLKRTAEAEKDARETGLHQ